MNFKRAYHMKLHGNTEYILHILYICIYIYIYTYWEYLGILYIYI